MMCRPSQTSPYRTGHHRSAKYSAMHKIARNTSTPPSLNSLSFHIFSGTSLFLSVLRTLSIFSSSMTMVLLNVVNRTVWLLLLLFSSFSLPGIRRWFSQSHLDGARNVTKQKQRHDESPPKQLPVYSGTANPLSRQNTSRPMDDLAISA